MKSLLSASLLLLLVISPSGKVSAADQVEAALATCGSCHGVSAAPKDTTVPIIDGQLAGYLEKLLRAFQSGERENQIMSSMAESLRPADVARASAIIAARPWPKIAPVAAVGEPEAVVACRSCHGADLGGAPGPEGVAPRLSGQSADYLEDQMSGFARGERANAQTMTSVMAGLDGAERAIIAKYLAGLSN